MLNCKASHLGDVGVSGSCRKAPWIHWNRDLEFTICDSEDESYEEAKSMSNGGHEPIGPECHVAKGRNRNMYCHYHDSPYRDGHFVFGQPGCTPGKYGRGGCPYPRVTNRDHRYRG